jgi:hypothetical protein
MAVYVQCYPQFIGITKEMMSRGPHVVDMEYREIDDWEHPHAQTKTRFTTTHPRFMTMASTTSSCFQKTMGLSP